MEAAMVARRTTIEANHAGPTLPLNTVKPMPHTLFNRVFGAIYACAILALLDYRAVSLVHSRTLVSFFVTLTLLISDLLLAFMWTTTLALRLFPVSREEFPENLEKVMSVSDIPGLDVFICTADPYKEPPLDTVNTTLSVIAYDYPTEKLSIYVSDDGGSAMTLFALMEAAKFAAYWIPFCKKIGTLDRNPEAYFASNHSLPSEVENLKTMYGNMKMKVEHVIERGKVDDHYITSDQERQVFSKWTDDFTRRDHPTVIQVLLDRSKDKDTAGHSMPNLIYVSREKRKTTHHFFKAGALNALLRVSAVMTNAPIMVNIDCDMYSNDPKAPLRVLCHLCDPHHQKPNNICYVQFPQRFRRINKNDIYAGEFVRLYDIYPWGYDGLIGPSNYGSGTFFRRSSLFGSPKILLSPEIPELGPDYVVDKPVQSQHILALAQKVAGCYYEKDTDWGSKIGFKYGSMVEDFLTDYEAKCEGWTMVYCNPERAAFYGDAPSCLLDMLNQQKRWGFGMLQISLSKISTITYGVTHMGFLMGLAYSQLAFWHAWSIPVTAYAYLPQLALLNKVYIFPKISEPWFLLYAFLFFGAYGQDFFEFTVVAGKTARRWWNDQRIWHIRALSCFLFGAIEYFLHSLGISGFDFNVTSKVVDEEQRKRYEQGIFEFGVHSPMFVSLAMVALVNLIAFAQGLVHILRGEVLGELFAQMFIAGFAVVNCWPVYEAMVLRSDKGKVPIKTTIIATFLVGALYKVASFIFK